PDAIDDVGGETNAEDNFGGESGRTEAAGDRSEGVAEEVSDEGVGADVERGTDGVVLEEVGEAHFHAARERRRHGVDAGDEFGEEESLFATAIEIFGGAENATFGIGGEAAEKAEEGPSADAAHVIEDEVSDDHDDKRYGEDEVEMHTTVGGDGSGGEEREGGGDGEADGLGETHDA